MVPYPSQWHSIALATLHGMLIISPRHGLQAAYDAEVRARLERKFGRVDPRWSAYNYEKAFVSGEQTLVSLQRVSHLTVAPIQPYRTMAGARPCPFCHMCVDLLQPHLHGDRSHAEIVLSLAEVTVLDHGA